MADDGGLQASGASAGDHPERFDPADAADLSSPIHVQSLLLHGGETAQPDPPPAMPAEPRTSHAGPREPTEALLCEVWGELLGVEQIGIDDDVFDLGAHSLTVMWAAARILDRTGLDLPSRWFYEEPTVAGLARLIAGAPPGGSTRGAR